MLILLQCFCYIYSNEHFSSRNIEISAVIADGEVEQNNDDLLEECLSRKCDSFHDAHDMGLKGVSCDPMGSMPLVYICHCHPRTSRVINYNKLVKVYKRINEDSPAWCHINAKSVDVNESSSAFNENWDPVSPPPKDASPKVKIEYLNRAVYRFKSTLIKVHSLAKEITKIKELPSFQEFLSYGGWLFLVMGIVLYIMTSVLVTYFSRYHFK